MKLVIANKVYSSWSLRPWLLMKQLGIPFEEVLMPFGPTFDDPEWKRAVAAYTPAGKVPALIDGELQVWDTLAIMEYLAEKRPDLPIWPTDAAARAMARSISAEMHSGFVGLRGACPMNLGRRYAGRDRGPGVAADAARIMAIWREARERFGRKGGGPFLFGSFCAADAMYAPVATRLDTYGFALDADTRAYVDAILVSEGYRAWLAEALAEPWIVPEDEVDEPAIANLRRS